MLGGVRRRDDIGGYFGAVWQIGDEQNQIVGLYLNPVLSSDPRGTVALSARDAR